MNFCKSIDASLNKIVKYYLPEFVLCRGANTESWTVGRHFLHKNVIGSYEMIRKYTNAPRVLFHYYQHGRSTVNIDEFLKRKCCRQRNTGSNKRHTILIYSQYFTTHHCVRDRSFENIYIEGLSFNHTVNYQYPTVYRF